MANLKFYGSEETQTEEHTLECFVSTKNDIFLKIEASGYSATHLCLDIPTAIAFRKHLAQQIAIAKEVNNG